MVRIYDYNNYYVKGTLCKVESIMLQNLFIMLLAFPQFSGYSAHFYGLLDIHYADNLYL